MKENTKAFFISIRVQGKVHKIPISLGDSKEELLKKFARVYPACRQQQETALLKIKEQLLELRRNNSTKQEFKQLIERYIDKVFASEEETITEDQVSQVTGPSRTKSCCVVGMNVNES